MLFDSDAGLFMILRWVSFLFQGGVHLFLEMGLFLFSFFRRCSFYSFPYSFFLVRFVSFLRQNLFFILFGVFCFKEDFLFPNQLFFMGLFFS